jgi:hypothetical protein
MTHADHSYRAKFRTITEGRVDAQTDLPAACISGAL